MSAWPHETAAERRGRLRAELWLDTLEQGPGIDREPDLPIAVVVMLLAAIGVFLAGAWAAIWYLLRAAWAAWS